MFEIKVGDDQDPFKSVIMGEVVVTEKTNESEEEFLKILFRIFALSARLYLVAPRNREKLMNWVEKFPKEFPQAETLEGEVCTYSFSGFISHRGKCNACGYKSRKEEWAKALPNFCGGCGRKIVGVV